MNNTTFDYEAFTNTFRALLRQRAYSGGKLKKYSIDLNLLNTSKLNLN